MSLNWRDYAACRDQAPTFDYFVDGETPAERKDRLEVATAMCAGCSVIDQCRAAVDPLLDDGVRAGVVLEKIRNVRAGGGRGDVLSASSRKQPIKHNTQGGYRAHVRRGEKPCQLCREAELRCKQDRRKKAS